MNDFEYEAEWWRGAFDEGWLKMFAHKAKAAPREARAIGRMLNLPTRSKVLDLCCGDGRIATQLARLGYDVTGLDLSLPLIEVAQHKAELANLHIRWVRADMREIGFEDEFDAVISISTSFGYFASESDDAKTLHSAHTALTKRGKLLLDLENVYYLSHMYRLYGSVPTYQPVNRFRGWLEEATLFDPVSHTVKMRLRLYHNGKVVKEVRGGYRVYSLSEMRRVLESCGFHIRSTYGDFYLRPYDIDSPRMIIICERSDEVANHQSDTVSGRIAA